MIEINIITIAVISVLLFGLVELWSFSIVSIAISLSSLYYAFNRRLSINGSRVFLFSLFLLLFPFIQLIPLPFSLLKTIHPGISNLFEMPSGLNPSLHSVSIYPHATEMEMIRLVVSLMFFLMTAYGIDGKNGVRKIVKMLSIFGFFLSLFSIIQYASWNGKIYWFRELTQGGTPFGPYVNRNHFAGLMGMIVPMSLGLAFSEREKEKKILFIFLSVIMTLALFFSLSRGGIISFLGGISVFAFVIIGKWRSTKRLLPLFIFLVIVLLYLLYLGIDPIVERFYKTDITAEERLTVWKASLPVIKDFLILGSGLGTFQYIFKSYKPEGLYGYWDHAHNDYIELLIETGIFGFMLVSVFIIMVFKGLFRNIGRDIYLKASLISSIVTMLIHSFFDFNLHIPSNAIFFSMVLGLAVAIHRHRNTEDRSVD